MGDTKERERVIFVADYRENGGEGATFVVN